MLVKVDRALCTGCNTCHAELRDAMAIAAGLPGMPDIAFDKGYVINDRWLREFGEAVYRASKNCPTGAISIDPSPVGAEPVGAEPGKKC